MEIVFLIIGLLLGAVITYFVVKNKFRNNGISQSQVDELHSQISKSIHNKRF